MHSASFYRCKNMRNSLSTSHDKNMFLVHQSSQRHQFCVTSIHRLAMLLCITQHSSVPALFCADPLKSYLLIISLHSFVSGHDSSLTALSSIGPLRTYKLPDDVLSRVVVSLCSIKLCDREHQQGNHRKSVNAHTRARTHIFAENTGFWRNCYPGV